MVESDKEFKCKYFIVKHGVNTFPVTTEALIFGAYLAQNISDEKLSLEIGTGCGLLPLMITQKSSVFIHAVEIDGKAFEIAFENIKNAGFSNQIGIFHTDIQHFTSEIGINEYEKYDLIFTNPPFYQNHLKGNAVSKNIAMHNDLLSFTELAKTVKRFSHEKTKIIVLLPPNQLNQLEIELKTQKLIKTNEFQIHHRQNSKVLRIIATFGYKLTDFQPSHFFIKDENENYTQQFKDLLKDYYLIF